MELPEGVTMEKLLNIYNQYQKRVKATQEYLKTDEGKEYNRQKAREYYARHKEEVLAKRAKRYEDDKETLLNRSNAYYKAHAEELNAKARERRERQKIESSPV